MMMSKQEARVAARRVLRELSAQQQSLASVAIAQRLVAVRGWESLRAVAFYLPLGGEVDVLPVADALASRGCRLAVPAWAPSSERWVFAWWNPAALMCQGPLGTKQPAILDICPTDAVEAILVPALAVDHAGTRLGRGGGIYDRLLAAYTGLRIAPLFAAQFVERLPSECHDQRIDLCVTEATTYSTSAKASSFLSRLAPIPKEPSR